MYLYELFQRKPCVFSLEVFPPKDVYKRQSLL